MSLTPGISIFVKFFDLGNSAAAVQLSLMQSPDASLMKWTERAPESSMQPMK